MRIQTRSGLGIYALPELQNLLDSLTFHISFDDESFTPELAAGEEFEPKIYPAYNTTGPNKALFAAGIRGRALVLGTGAAAFADAGNLSLDSRGALALWVKPVSWQRPNGSNSVFLMSQRATFYLQRQGPKRAPGGKILRHECMQYLAKCSLKDKHFTSLTGGVWENGRWVFIVANWSWPTMQLSIDGKPFSVKSLPARPRKKLFAGFLIGARGGDRGLLDEVMAFSRPLTLPEVRQLRDLVPSSANP